MAEKTPQTLQNHERIDPKFHRVLLPFAGLNIVYAVYRGVTSFSIDTLWNVLFAFAFAFAVLMIRLYSLRVQDRLIRLEERLRMHSVLPSNLHPRIGELTEGQIVALRFAPDAELPGLVEAALSQGLSQKDIKQKIKSWRPDYFRV